MNTELICLLAMLLAIMAIKYIYRLLISRNLIVVLILSSVGLYIAFYSYQRASHINSYRPTLCKIEKQTPVDTLTITQGSFYMPGGSLYCPDVLISYIINNEIYHKTIKLSCTENKNDQASILFKYPSFPCFYNVNDSSDVINFVLEGGLYFWYSTTFIGLLLFGFVIYSFIYGSKPLVIVLNTKPKSLIFILIIFTTFILAEIYVVKKEWRVNNKFQETICTIIDKKIETDRGKAIRYSASFNVEYIAMNNKYSHWISPGIFKYESSSIYSADTKLSQYQINNQYPCWYDPDYAYTVVLERGYSTFTYIFGFFIILLALMILKTVL